MAIDIRIDIQQETLEMFSGLYDILQLGESLEASIVNQQTHPTLHVIANDTNTTQSETAAIVTPLSECSSIATVTPIQSSSKSRMG